MAKDEFNIERITNEGKNPNFEFGNTQDNESTSYFDNNDRLRDEVNDNPTSNNENKSPEKEERRKQEEQRENESKESKENSNGSGSEGSSSAGGSAGAASSASATVATVAGAALVSVTTLSTLVGINLFFAGRCQMNQFDVTHESLVYELELTEIGEDNCVIKLENADIKFVEEQNLIEGVNSGQFTDLTPDTNYHVSVVDLTYENFVLFEQNIKTLSEEVKTYVVTFITNGGSSVETQLIAEGGVVIEPTAPTKDGYNFGGWYIDAELTQKYDFTTPVTKDISLYAGWFEAIYYTVTFESNGGTAVESQSIAAGEVATKPTNPTKSGYTFTGWYTDAELTTKYDFATVISADLTLYAGWSNEALAYSVSFDANGGSGTMGSLELDANSEYSLPVCIFVPSYDAYFGGWQINGEGDIHQPGETIVVNSDTTLVAQWIKFPTQEKTVTANRLSFFYLFPEEPSNDADTISLTGIDFLYKNTYYSSTSQSLNIVNNADNADGFVSTTTPFGGTISSITITTSASQSGNVDLTMVYSASPIYEKVTDQGETHTLAADSTHTFECTNPDARYFCLSNAASLEAFIYSMKFDYNAPKIENSFTVYFDANGGTGSCDPFTVSNANTQPIPTLERVGFVAPDGYEFAGWKVKSVEDLLTPGTLVGISSDVTLVAQWKEKGPIQNYTITFNTKGGSTVESQTVEEGSRAVKPDDPTREGFTLLDWYTDSELTNPYDFNEPVTSDLVLIAGWKPDIDFTMYINYFDSLSASPSYQLSYSYTKKDDYSIFTDYCLEIDGDETINLPISSLENTDTALTQTLQLGSEAQNQLGNGIVNYTMKGYTSIGETFDLATGSFSASRTQKDHVSFIYFGDKQLQGDTGEIYRVMKSGSDSSPSYYIPVRFDYADFTNKHRADTSNDWRLRYTLDGDTYTNATFSYSSGTAFINISSTLFQTTDTVTFKEISFLDGNSTSPQQIGDVYENVKVQASDEKYVGGFRLNTSYLLNPSKTPTFTLSAVGTRGVDLDNPNDNHRYINLGVEDDGFKASLTFRLLSKKGQIEKEYVIDVTQKLIDNAGQSIMYTNVQFDFIDGNVDKREEFIEQSKRYVVDVVLTIVTRGTPEAYYTSYESYSFR